MFFFTNQTINRFSKIQTLKTRGEKKEERKMRNVFCDDEETHFSFLLSNVGERSFINKNLK
jgi:hypothetical protein